jgi:hypothetical protein
MENVKTLVEAGGGTKDSILQLTVYLTKIDDYDGMNKVFKTYFPNGGLARTTVAVAALPGQSLVEINCTVVSTGFGSTGNVYEELGVTTIINGEGTMTVLGGSLMRPEVEALMSSAGRHLVPIIELEVAAGQRIAQMTNLPKGYSAIITSGAAAAMQSGGVGEARPRARRARFHRCRSRYASRFASLGLRQL